MSSDTDLRNISDTARWVRAHGAMIVTERVVVYLEAAEAAGLAEDVARLH